MTASSRRRVACVALAALLFSAVSPALAALLFAGHGEVLGRLLGLPAVSVPAADAVPEGIICHDETAAAASEQPAADASHHADAGHESDEGSGHAAHGTFCSFCLSPGATAALPAPTAVAVVPASAAAVLLTLLREQPPAARYAASRHPRDPPVLSRL